MKCSSINKTISEWQVFKVQASGLYQRNQERNVFQENLNLIVFNVREKFNFWANSELNWTELHTTYKHEN